MQAIAWQRAEGRRAAARAMNLRPASSARRTCRHRQLNDTVQAARPSTEAACDVTKKLARPKRFELLTPRFVVSNTSITVRFLTQPTLASSFDLIRFFCLRVVCRFLACHRVTDSIFTFFLYILAPQILVWGSDFAEHEHSTAPDRSRARIV
jgi:hypothetical protein